MRRVTKTAGYSLIELLVALAIAGLIGAAILGVYKVSQDTYIRASSLEAAQVGARAGLDRMANELRLIGSYWVGACKPPVPNCAAITAASPTSITFMANVDNVDALSVSNGTEVRVSATASGATVPLNISATATADAFKVYANSALNDYIYIADGGTREVRQISSTFNGNTNVLPLTSNLSSTYPVPGSVIQNVLVRDVKTITYARNTGNNTLTRTQGGDPAPDPIVDNVTGLTFTYFQSDGVTPTTNPAQIREIQIDLTVQSPDGSARRMTTRVKPRSLSLS